MECVRQLDFCATEMDLQVAMISVDGGDGDSLVLVWLDNE